jgi:protease PrsW
MDRFAILATAIAPGIFVLTYGVIKTNSDWKNEALWTAFFLGAISTFAVIPVEWGIRWLIGLTSLPPVVKGGMLALIEAAIPEEAVKYLILVGVAERHVDARRRQDIIMLALAVSLGFATVENFLYVVTLGHWQVIAVRRALTAVPEHGIVGLTMGALLTAARVKLDRRTMWAGLALIVPVIMHAAYDFPLLALRAGAAAPAGSTSAPFLIALWLVILLVESIIAIRLCNWILPAAKEADRLSGRDARSDIPAALVIAVCCFFVITIAALGIFIGANTISRLTEIGVSVAILPLALGIDLIRTAVRRRAEL